MRSMSQHLRLMKSTLNGIPTNFIHMRGQRLTINCTLPEAFAPAFTLSSIIFATLPRSLTFTVTLFEM